MEIAAGTDWRGELEALAAEGAALRADAEALQKSLAELLSVGEHGAVTVALDSFGLLVSMQIDDELREEATAEELVREVNLAIIRSRNALAAQLTPQWPTDADTSAAPMAAAGVAPIMAALTSGELPSPDEFSNDLGTVTVSTMWGTLVTVECEKSWIEATSSAAIADEIVRVARIASLRTDVLGRHTSGGHHE